jgi:hypothetical protein
MRYIRLHEINQIAWNKSGYMRYYSQMTKNWNMPEWKSLSVNSMIVNFLRMYACTVLIALSHISLRYISLSTAARWQSFQRGKIFVVTYNPIHYCARSLTLTTMTNRHQAVLYGINKTPHLWHQGRFLWHRAHPCDWRYVWRSGANTAVSKKIGKQTTGADKVLFANRQ